MSTQGHVAYQCYTCSKQIERSMELMLLSDFEPEKEFTFLNLF